MELAKASGVINMITDRLTVPFIIERMSKGFASPVTSASGSSTFSIDNSALVSTTELPVLLGNPDELKYLSDLWDCRENPYQYGTRGGGHLIIDKTNVNILGGATPAGIAECLPPQSISNGFASRIVFVYSETRAKDIEWPDVPPPDQDLVEDLRWIAGNVKGEFKFEPQARSVFESIYRASKPVPDDEEFTAHFKGRKWVHVAKLAIVHSAARDDSRIISYTDLTRSIQEVEQCEASLGFVFGRVGTFDLVTAADKVLVYLDKKGYASRGELVKALWRYFPKGGEDLTRILATFIDAGLIIEFVKASKTLYKLTVSLNAPAGTTTNP
ncbi:MAG: hypothetical protein Q7J56_01795 [Deltaproteobacteria bacterium]|nr:hypothetical protein [Deltaproteobacteria bacterium]